MKSVTEFARKAAEFYQKYPHIPNVASICIYPSFVETVGLAVDGTPMKITSVGGGFPAAQTFLEVKALEVAMAVENGADEVDIVLNVGRMLTGEYDEAANEVEVIRTEMDDDVVLKVIIESGALKTPELIRKASLLSMLAGADSAKTSTGKIDVAATPGAAAVMCQAIRDYHENRPQGRVSKAAGRSHTAEDARSTRSSRRYSAKSGSTGYSTSGLFGREQHSFGHRRLGGSNASNRHETGWRRSAGPFLADRPPNAQRRPCRGRRCADPGLRKRIRNFDAQRIDRPRSRSVLGRDAFGGTSVRQARSGAEVPRPARRRSTIHRAAPSTGSCRAGWPATTIMF